MASCPKLDWKSRSLACWARTLQDVAREESAKGRERDKHNAHTKKQKMEEKEDAKRNAQTKEKLHAKTYSPISLKIRPWQQRCPRSSFSLI
jgi:hypothetical protein